MFVEDSNISVKKQHGRFYTPSYIVKNILDLVGYYGNDIIKKHIIDNSCGDGAFIVEFVERYCEAYIKENSSSKGLKEDLEEYIHGIEIDNNEVEKCRQRVDLLVARYNLIGVNWDICCNDTLYVDRYNGQMDFVVGNPPYVRVHNLKEQYDRLKTFSFCSSGMTDIYLVFYEIGINMLKKDGKLGYITPSSFYNSIAGSSFRNYLFRTNKLSKIVDLKHFQPFEATTYTTIVVIENNKIKNEIEFFLYDNDNLIPYFVNTLTSKEIFIENKFVFGTKEELQMLKEILTYTTKKKYFEVKNGFATLFDEFFIGEFEFSDFVVPIIKASTGKWKYCIFPYKDNTLISFEEIEKKASLKNYYIKHKQKLQSRSLERNSQWWAYGRSQGIKDIKKDKIAINTLLRDKSDIKINYCERGTAVYSGLYILTSINKEILEDMLINDDFVNYVSLLSKYKSGGYYTFSSKDLQKYLDYKYDILNNTMNKNEQFELFADY